MPSLSTILAEGRRVDREEESAVKSRAKFLADPTKVDSFVSKIFQQQLPASAKVQPTKFATRTDAVDAGFSEADPRRGMGQKIKNDFNRLVADERFADADPQELLAHVTAGHIENSRLRIHQYTREQQSSLIGGDDVRPLSDYGDWLANEQAREAGQQEADGSVSFVGDAPTNAAIGATFGAASVGLRNTKVGTAIVKQVAKPFAKLGFKSAVRAAARGLAYAPHPVAKVAGAALLAVAEFWMMDKAMELVDRSEWGQANRDTNKVAAAKLAAGLLGGGGAAVAQRSLLKRGLKTALKHDLLNEAAKAQVAKFPTGKNMLRAHEAELRLATSEKQFLAHAKKESSLLEGMAEEARALEMTERRAAATGASVERMEKAAREAKFAGNAKDRTAASKILEKEIASLEKEAVETGAEIPELIAVKEALKQDATKSQIRKLKNSLIRANKSKDPAAKQAVTEFEKEIAELEATLTAPGTKRGKTVKSQEAVRVETLETQIEEVERAMGSASTPKSAERLRAIHQRLVDQLDDETAVAMRSVSDEGVALIEQRLAIGHSPAQASTSVAESEALLAKQAKAKQPTMMDEAEALALKEETTIGTRANEIIKREDTLLGVKGVVELPSGKELTYAKAQGVRGADKMNRLQLLQETYKAEDAATRALEKGIIDAGYVPPAATPKGKVVLTNAGLDVKVPSAIKYGVDNPPPYAKLLKGEITEAEYAALIKNPAARTAEYDLMSELSAGGDSYLFNQWSKLQRKLTPVADDIAMAEKELAAIEREEGKRGVFGLGDDIEPSAAELAALEKDLAGIEVAGITPAVNSAKVAVAKDAADTVAANVVMEANTVQRAFKFGDEVFVQTGTGAKPKFKYGSGPKKGKFVRDTKESALQTQLETEYAQQAKTGVSSKRLVEIADEFAAIDATTVAVEAEKAGKNVIKTPVATEKEFVALANAQRGAPEAAMLKVQKVNVGGVLNPVVEHAGDLTHRMAESPTFETAGYEFVKDKVTKVLRSLKHEYGFEKEMLENITNNAKYKGKDVTKLTREIDNSLKKYAEEHAKLPVFNEAQKVAQDVAVAIGEKDWQRAISNLEILESKLGSVDQWKAYAQDGLGATTVKTKGSILRKNSLKTILAFGGIGASQLILGADEADAGILDTTARIFVGAFKQEAKETGSALAKQTAKLVEEMSPATIELGQKILSPKAATYTNPPKAGMNVATKRMPFYADKWLSPHIVGEFYYKNLHNPMVEIASKITAAYADSNGALEVMKNILADVPGATLLKNNFARREVIAAMEPLEKLYGKSFARSGQATGMADVLKTRLNAIQKRVAKGEGDFIEETRILEEHLDKFRGVVAEEAPALAKFEAEWLATVKPLAAKHASTRIALAMEDTASYEVYPWLAGMLSGEEKLAVGHMKEMMQTIGGRIKNAGGNVIKDKPYIHHAMHPSKNFNDVKLALKDLAYDIDGAPIYSKIHSRMLGSKQMVPELTYVMERYLPDVSKRINMMEFWGNSGWESHANAVSKNNPAMAAFWGSVKDGFKPAESTFANRFARNYTSFEVLRLLALSPSVAFKHLIKVSATMAQFPLVTTISILPKSIKAAMKIGINRNYNNSWLHKRIGGSGSIRLTEQEQLVDSFTKQGHFGESIADLNIRDIPTEGVGLLINKMNEVGSIPVRAVELFDRSHAVLASMEMAGKKGMTAQQSMEAVYKTILQNNFLGGNQNPAWLRNPKIRAMMMFQGTPFKIAERRLLIAIRAGQDIGEAGRITLKLMQQMKNGIKEGELEMKKGMIWDAITGSKDQFATPYTATFMKELLGLGAFVALGKTAMDVDLTAHVFHPPVLRLEKGGPMIALNPVLQDAYRISQYRDPDDFWMSQFFTNYTKGVGINTTFTKAMRLSDGDIPEIYKSASNPELAYFFSVPGKKQ